MIWNTASEVINSNGRISREEGLEWLCGNVDKILQIGGEIKGLQEGNDADFIAIEVSKDELLIKRRFNLLLHRAIFLSTEVKSLL
jgi:dihydroorotase-like cyclic amidohydrolase